MKISCTVSRLNREAASRPLGATASIGDRCSPDIPHVRSNMGDPSKEFPPGADGRTDGPAPGSRPARWRFRAGPSCDSLPAMSRSTTSALALAAALAIGCREPTEVVVDLSTNAGCDKLERTK